VSKEKGSILVVDDNVDLLKTLSLILQRSGYQVDMAEDGLSAVDKSKSHCFDVILMDIVMPRMNGVEAFREIRRINPGARVILMTAYYEDQLVKQVLHEGVHSALCKPIDIGWVVETIRGITSSPPILLVDDDADFCRTMARTLELEGHRVCVAHSGEEALELARRMVCQVALIDVKLPLMGGLETYIKLKEINPGIMTIMMTAYRDEVQDIVDQAMLASATACLYKPLDPTEVVGLVSHIGAQ